jgi:hypothetical protein
MSEKRPRANATTGWGILNPYGDVWTPEIFETPEQAQKHLEDFWKSFPGPNTDTRKFRIVKARVRVSAVYPVQYAHLTTEGKDA